jgi:NAD(P)-dependent dehydrogenase (short-subunit alcohol dehydrogenase family)
MKNKTILITGSTDGIGKLAATKLAKNGHNIILHGRNAEKLTRVKEEIKSLTKNDNIVGYVADFSILEEVRHMVSKIKEDHSTIDVLVNNAGVFKVANPISANGLDIRMVVNYLAPYILTDELIPILERSDNPRIINLSSAAQETVLGRSLEKNVSLSDNQAYAQSKLAILLWSFDFARKHKFITTIALNPGSLLNTNMVKEAYGKFWSPADKGADIIIDIAINPKYADKSGQYFDNDKGDFGQAHPDAYQSDKIEALISKTEELLGN